MTGESIECFNCGQSNPPWAQVCRSCGVGLRPAGARAAAGRIPTDRDSLVSIGAVVATMVLAMVIGLFIANMNPTLPTVGLVSPTPEPTATPGPTPVATPEPTEEPPQEETPEPTPELRGSLAFGTALAGDGTIASPADTFTPGMTFAYSLSAPEGIGGTPIRNEISRTSDPAEVVLDDPVNVDAAAEVVGYNLGNAAGFISDWGPGEYVWRIYVGEELVAEAPFRLADG